jgi:hypothetical protein
VGAYGHVNGRRITLISIRCGIDFYSAVMHESRPISAIGHTTGF